MLDAIIKKHNKKGALISLLQEVQEQFGCVSKQLIEQIAQKTNYSAAHIQGVASFYAQFREEPRGKNLISICQGTACHVNGSKKIFQAISDFLGVLDNETTADRRFTIQNVACLGCCSLAPAIMINSETFGKLDEKTAVGIIKNFND